MRIRVVAVDVGSVRSSSKFAWAVFDAPGRILIEHGADPEAAVSALVSGLREGGQAAVLLEAPMAVPVPGSKPGACRGLGKARAGEGTGHGRREPGPGHWRPGWPRGLGCFASWLPPFPSRRRRHSRAGRAPGQPRDAGLRRRCSPQDLFNLLAAMALWAELSIDAGELRADVLVVAAGPQPKP